MARAVLVGPRMNRRRVALQTPKQSSPSLAERLSGAERLPLDLALSVAVEVVEAVATAHQQRRAFGRLSAADFVVGAEGSMAITATAVPGADPATDTFDVGAVLYQVFTGLTPTQARARLQVSPLHDVPAASRLNPGIDDALEGVLALMLSRDPALRPHSLRVVEALLVEVCEALELEPSRAAILRWAQLVPALRVVTAPVRTPRFVEVEDDSEEEEEEEEVAPARLRFDSWTVAACAFCVVAFTMATRL